MYQNYFKRIIDFILAGIALIILSPIIFTLWIWLTIANKGAGAFFFQERPGKDEKIFKLYKFRTMTDERDEKGELLPDEVRLTEFGKMLRASSLDELPELFNILKGDMSIIGPRPLLVSYLPWYTEEEKHRHDVRPGLSGLAQVNGRNFVDWDRRLQFDIEYVKKITFLGDVKIIFMTIASVLKKSDVAVVTDDVEGNLAEIRAEKAKQA